ncbi:hydroxysqualene dehydroxylase HpnE [Herminiimonas glaciei]|uniref:Hydroxysqualene dehydroxylase HpnE n=1 Tax=Herminiimonas glaciei TaxID=523788 RepID=A0ABW2I9I2_9BURK
MTEARKIAVIGAGWAGCAAAVELASAGHAVTLFESSRTLGGRARAVELQDQTLDNGQHILLGAYSATLSLLKTLGVSAEQALLRLPLQMRYPAGCDGMDFVAPRLPAPLHLLTALLRAKGLDTADKMALARFSTTARWMEWRLHTDCSVTELLERYDQTARLIKLMWQPLCIAALNTPPERASAQVFLNVLRDSLGAKRAASDMLIPRTDLTSLLPQQAAAFVERHQGAVKTGAAVQSIRAHGQQWSLGFNNEEITAELFDGLVIATPALTAANLLAGTGAEAHIPAFDYEAITTCYLQYPAGTRLPAPFFALTDDATQGLWGQFVFDRGQLDVNQDGLFAIVVSISTAATELGQEALSAAIAQQLAQALEMPQLAQASWSKVITEKRATFSCTPGLQRPEEQTALPHLVIAGDYLASDYPATLESAVRSGVKAAKLLAQHFA